MCGSNYFQTKVWFLQVFTLPILENRGKLMYDLGQDR